MANTHLRDGYAANCTLVSGGTGPYTGLTNIAGYGIFSSFTDNEVIECTIRTATAFETGKYTKGGGATPSLARTRIFSQIDGSTNPVNWAAGTQVLIHTGLSAKDAATVTGENEFENHQHMKGKNLTLTTDKLSYLYGTGTGAGSLVAFAVNGTFHTALGVGGGTGEPYLTINHSDGGATPGPGLNLDRLSPSPTANDVIGYLNLSGRDDAGNYTIYAAIFGQINNAANGAESGAMLFNVMRAGASIQAASLSSNLLTVFPSFHDSGTGIVIGKFSPNANVAGVELLASGKCYMTANNDHPLTINRLASDTTLIRFQRDGSDVGEITVNSAGLVTLAGGGTSHQSLWDGPKPCPMVPPGTLLCSTDRMVDDLSGVHPCTRLCIEESDPAVYGVYGGPKKVQLRDQSHRRGLMVQASGTGAIRVVGPVRHGQLLEGSSIPGVARGQESRAQQDGTVAKARATVPAGEQRLIPCTLMGG